MTGTIGSSVCSRDGRAEFQAGSCAVRGLRRALKRFAPARTLEVDAGGGTLTRIVVDTLPAAEVWFIEPIDDLAAVAPLEAGRRLTDETVSAHARFDFVIIDGGSTSPEYYHALPPRGVIFVEGGRRPQRRFH